MFRNTFIKQISCQSFAPEQVSYLSSSMGPTDQHGCAEPLPGLKDSGVSGRRKRTLVTKSACKLFGIL